MEESRRLLLTTKQINKKLISFMAYWRRGQQAP
ncbi:MAG: siderophore-interacting protein [Pseudomonadales bacterium]|nr:siderophore-interacting protein [Pseudomonadales bacterium]